MSFTTGSYPPFANPHIAELAAQLDASLGQANGLSQYLNQSLGEAISANAQIINAVAGSPTVVLVTLDHASICYTTAGPLNVTLPPIGGVGRMCEIIKASNDANGVTVNTPAGITFVDGTTQFNLYNQNDYVDIICNPANLQWSIRGYRQRGLAVNGGFSGLAGQAGITAIFSSQTIPTATFTTVAFNTLNFDTGLPSKYWNSGSPNQLVAPVKGIYDIRASVQLGATEGNSAFATVVYASMDQIVCSSTPGQSAYGLISFDTIEVTRGQAMYTTSTPTQLTAPVGGMYLVCAGIAAHQPAYSSGQITMQLFKNGTGGTVLAQSAKSSDDTFNPSNQISAIVDMIPGDYVCINMYESFGGTLTAYGGTSTFLSLALIDLAALENVYIVIDGAYAAGGSAPQTTTVNGALNASVVAQLNLGSIVTLQMYQNTGNDMTLITTGSGANFNPAFTINQIG